ncbi:MAG: hypothetical protein QE570_00285 [Verrucomicrobiota bacterium]|nr:hypothetical protein [Verrucomicrobiota bacterium]
MKTKPALPPAWSLFVAFAIGAFAIHFLHEKARHAASDAFEKTQAELRESLASVTQERDALRRSVAGLQDETVRLRRANSLQATIQREHQDSTSNNQTSPGRQPIHDTPFMQAVLALTTKAAELNQHFLSRPNAEVPEMQFLAASDWFKLAETADLSTEAGIRKALSETRRLAKKQFSLTAVDALRAYAKVNDGRFPNSPTELAPFFNGPVQGVLDRYQIRRMPGTLGTGVLQGEIVMDEKSPVDREIDTHFYITPKSYYSFQIGDYQENSDPDRQWATR